jgi:hypothetical protein
MHVGGAFCFLRVAYLVTVTETDIPTFPAPSTSLAAIVCDPCLPWQGSPITSVVPYRSALALHSCSRNHESGFRIHVLTMGEWQWW